MRMCSLHWDFHNKEYKQIQLDKEFTSTTELSGVWHKDSWAPTGPSTAWEEMTVEDWLGVTQGDNMKLRADEASGDWETEAGVLQGERGRSKSTGWSCSLTTEIVGSNWIDLSSSGTESSCVETDSGCWIPSGRVSTESTSLTGEKQTEMFVVPFLSGDSWCVSCWDFGAGVSWRVRHSWAGVWTGRAEEACAWTGVWARARDRRVTLLGERYVEQGEAWGSTAALRWLDLLTGTTGEI